MNKKLFLALLVCFMVFTPTAAANPGFVGTPYPSAYMDKNFCLTVFGLISLVAVVYTLKKNNTLKMSKKHLSSTRTDTNDLEEVELAH